MKQSTETQKSFVVDDSFSTFAATSPLAITRSSIQYLLLSKEALPERHTPASSCYLATILQS